MPGETLKSFSVCVTLKYLQKPFVTITQQTFFCFVAIANLSQVLIVKLPKLLLNLSTLTLATAQIREYLLQETPVGNCYCKLNAKEKDVEV